MATRQLRKGEQTHAAILETALAMASREGLEGLTIGSLADRMKMSKSGVFAHFGSREDLQIAVVKLYHHQFEQEIFYPAMNEPRGLPRLRALFSGWVKRVTLEIASGCIYISGAVEYDDRPGAVREELAGMVQTWQRSLRRCVQQAIDEGHLRADTDPDQMVFEMYGLVLALHHDARFIQRPGSVQHAQTGFERLIESYRNPAAAILPAATPTKPTKKTA
ncbi:TetR family transcriptional regulator [Paucimonas lemoignei]|uniref:TetR family transcriptional regulator n=1 Tax=Paucimonas lemoignei TaxID=29443 RepID=A0A4R3HZN2_PAULE|nr:TetR/AcrR family transcriptional regulator [Paucimonas lemoignei]TCS36979.1 TetR family transcriptional regulator [Paucimonas lemoignei]